MSTNVCVDRYRWLKDSRHFDVMASSDRIMQVPGEGTFVISQLRAEDEGVYQCFAENGNGTAVDREINFRKTCKFICSISRCLHVVHGFLGELTDSDASFRCRDQLLSERRPGRGRRGAGRAVLADVRISGRQAGSARLLDTHGRATGSLPNNQQQSQVDQR